MVAALLVVYGSIGHAELFADAGHQVGGLVDDAVGEGELQLFERLHVVAVGQMAGGQRAVGTCYLIDVTIGDEEVERASCQQKGDGVGGYAVGIEVFEGRQIVVHQALTIAVVGQMFGQGL